MRQFAQTFVCSICGKEGPKTMLCSPVPKLGMSQFFWCGVRNGFLISVTIWVAIGLLLTSCADPLCGYHGSGCGYIDTNGRNMAAMPPEQLKRELKK